ncbi:MAG: hypothetical protein H0V80_02135, partial [Acidobacteria bacterium]|nr:hypothetical protein [Acidobacteriota bacterium]
LTALLYTGLAALSGARVPGPAGAVPVFTQRRAPQAVPASAPAVPRPTPYLFGAFSLGALIACLVLPADIAGLPAAAAVQSMPSMHRWLLVATLVYFVAGTAYYLTRYADK